MHPHRLCSTTGNICNADLILYDRQTESWWQQFEGQAIVVFWQGGTLSPLYAPLIFESKEVGSAQAFSREVNGQELTFESGKKAVARDIETGSSWKLFGTAVDGPLTGEQLSPLPTHEFFWFVWSAFQPDTIIYQNEAEAGTE